LAKPQVISERFDGHVHGRAVKVGEPGGRLAEELKVMQVSACAQGGKDVGRFHNMVLFRFSIYQKIIIRYSVNKIIKKLSHRDNFIKPLGVGESPLPRTLGGAVGCTSQSGQPAIEATPRIFGSAKRLLQRSKIEDD
jgi:hypothetical protein